MTLTHDDVKLLTAKFPAKEHEFLKGNVYIREGAITTRLEEVDPSWSFDVVNAVQRNETITIYGRLTVCGVSRDGVGMAQVVMTTNGAREANEAEKSAATDALKRAARLFGIGRYLLDTPDGVTDHKTLANWLNGETQQQRPPAPLPQPTVGQPIPSPAAKDKNWLDPTKWSEAHWNNLKAEFGANAVVQALGVDSGRNWKGSYQDAVDLLTGADIKM